MSFLRFASERGAALAVAPEYFCPWNALQEAILSGLHPKEGELWVLGCESADEATVEQFKAAIAGQCHVIHEAWVDLPADRTILDTAVLLFRAPRADGSTHLVAVLQFKMCACRDEHFLEEGLLRRGSRIYRIRGRTGHLSVATINCSDAFCLAEDAVQELAYNSTLIHIQLNPDPRNARYRKYRTQIFETDEYASRCHIICLNWARGIEQHDDQGRLIGSWNNIAGSTWYCPQRDCSADDAIVGPNHQQGVYYAYMKERRHALLFHYDEAVFELLVPKVLTTAPAVRANRNGPSAIRRLAWNGAAERWDAAPNPDAGFQTLLAGNAAAQMALRNVLATNDPLMVERFLALSSGQISGKATWTTLPEIDSCALHSDEVVCRVTVNQDPLGHEFRHHRLQVAAEIQHELANSTRWPPQVSGLDANASLAWSPNEPNFNARTATGMPTLVVFLGSSPPSRATLEDKVDMLYELQRRQGGAHWKRICVLYREFGTTKHPPIGPLTRIDDPDEDKTEITSVAPLVEGQS